MNPSPQPVRTSLWPYAIIGWFAIVIVAAAVYISFAVKQRVDLVSPDYYEQELKHQQKMERIARTQPLRSLVHVAYDSSSNSIAIQLPTSHGGPGTTGSVELYRPSNASLDRRVELKLGPDASQRIDATGLASGFWKVQVTWKVGAVEFFVDEPVVLAPGPKSS